MANAAQQPRRWQTVALGLIASALAICVLALVVLSWINQRSAVRTSLLWARLEAIPASATERYVESTGGMFSRGFLVEFSAPKEDIAAWLRASAGTKHAHLELDSVGQTISILPGGGAQFAAVEIVWLRGRVRIRTYWS